MKTKTITLSEESFHYLMHFLLDINEETEGEDVEEIGSRQVEKARHKISEDIIQDIEGQLSEDEYRKMRYFYNHFDWSSPYPKEVKEM